MKKQTIRETIWALLDQYYQDLEPDITVSQCRLQGDDDCDEKFLHPSAVAVELAREVFTGIVDEWWAIADEELERRGLLRQLMLVQE